MPDILVVFPDSGRMWAHASAMLFSVLGDRLAIQAIPVTSLDTMVGVRAMLSFTLAEDIAAGSADLGWVQSLGTGYDKIHLVRRPDVILTTTRGLHGAAVSEAAMAMLLAIERDVARMVVAQSEQRWDSFPSNLLHGKRMGIVGTGDIAQSLAKRVKAFDVSVCGFSACPRAMANFDAVYARSDISTHIGSLDYLVLLTALDDTSRHMIDAGLLGGMKDGAILLNLGRGNLIAEEDLARELATGRIRAGLDTVSIEPLPAESPLWRMPNILIAPHNAGRHVGYGTDAAKLFLDNLALFDAGRIETMLNRVSFRTEAHL